VQHAQTHLVTWFRHGVVSVVYLRYCGIVHAFDCRKLNTVVQEQILVIFLCSGIIFDRTGCYR
jgi:hypothetical protein